MIIVKKTCVFFKLNNPILFNSASTMLLGNSLYFVLFMVGKMKERVYIKELKKQSEINNIYSGYQPEISEGST